jgi:predicted DsbA family dithiol-disulfide isomerase
MAPDGPTDARDPGTPGASAVAPAGTAALVVYSDPRCPWAHVAVRRLLASAERQGVETELCVDHRWFPLDDGAMPTDGEALDRKLEAIRSLEPDATWHRWTGASGSFPASSRLAAAWVQGAKRSSAAASMGLDRALREALFDDGRDISDESVVIEVAGGVDEVDVDLVGREVASGRPDEELERHAELARSELVPASPTIVLTDGSTWTNPGIEFSSDDGVPTIDRDDPTVHDDIVEAFLALRHYD